MNSEIQARMARDAEHVQRSQARWTHCIRMNELYRVLGFVGNKIPASTELTLLNFPVPMRSTSNPTRTLNLLVYPAQPTAGRKSSKHRVCVECPHCNVIVPAGRLHQHIYSQKCEDNRTVNTQPPFKANVGLSN